MSFLHRHVRCDLTHPETLDWFVRAVRVCIAANEQREFRRDLIVAGALCALMLVV